MVCWSLTLTFTPYRKHLHSKSLHWLIIFIFLVFWFFYALVLQSNGPVSLSEADIVNQKTSFLSLGFPVCLFFSPITYWLPHPYLTILKSVVLDLLQIPEFLWKSTDSLLYKNICIYVNNDSFSWHFTVSASILSLGHHNCLVKRPYYTHFIDGIKAQGVSMTHRQRLTWHTVWNQVGQRINNRILGFRCRCSKLADKRLFSDEDHINKVFIVLEKWMWFLGQQPQPTYHLLTLIF